MLRGKERARWNSACMEDCIYIYICICNYHNIPKGTFDDEFLVIYGLPDCKSIDYPPPTEAGTLRWALRWVFSCFLLQVPPTAIIRIPHEPYDSDRDLILVVGGAKTLCPAYEFLQDTTPHPTQANPPHEA